MPAIFHTDFRQTFGTGRYPFSDTSTLVSSEGLTLPNDTIVDASLYIIGAEAGVGIRQIIVTTSGISIVIGDNTSEQLASGTFDKFSPPASVTIVDVYGRPAGVLVTDAIALAIFQTWDPGTYLFESGTAEFVASCTIAVPNVFLRGIRLPDGTLLAGDVWLAGKDGVVLREESGNIRCDIVGDPLFLRKLCSPSGRFETPLFLERINNIGPNDAGDFTITVASNQASDTALRIFPVSEDTLKIEIAGRTIRG